MAGDIQNCFFWNCSDLRWLQGKTENTWKKILLWLLTKEWYMLTFYFFENHHYKKVEKFKKGSEEWGKKPTKIKPDSVISKKIRRNWQTLKHTAVGHVEHKTLPHGIQLLLLLHQELETMSCAQSDSLLYITFFTKHDGLIFPSLAGRTEYQSAWHPLCNIEKPVFCTMHHQCYHTALWNSLQPGIVKSRI